MSGYTPGPWLVRHAGKPDNVGGYDVAITAELFGSPRIIAECFEVVDTDSGRLPVSANARLVAAAPDLYAALELLLADVFRSENSGTDKQIDRGVMHQARLALAKAIGSSPPTQRGDND